MSAFTKRTACSRAMRQRSASTAALVAGAVAATWLGGVSPAQAAGPGKIPAEWVGRYQAKVVSASSGIDGDGTTVFGKGMTQTTINMKSLACATDFTMDVAPSGSITGRGRIMYVLAGSANNPMTAMAPGAFVAMQGGLSVSLKDGKQFRDWSFTGEVAPDGTVTLQGLPEEKMDRLNVGKWEKQTPWSPLPVSDKSKMRGPFTLKLAQAKGQPPTIQSDTFFDLESPLIRKVHYQTFIVKSDADIKPACKYDAPAAPKCAASEYLKTKAQIGVEGFYTVETSRDLKSGESSTTSKTGGGEMSGGFSTDSSGNVAWEGGAGLLVGSTQFNPTDSSYQVTVGIGVDTGKLLPGPAKLSEKVELVFDSACGVGIKGTAGVNAGATGAGVEGAIFLTKAL